MAERGGHHTRNSQAGHADGTTEEHAPASSADKLPREVQARPHPARARSYCIQPKDAVHSSTNQANGSALRF